MSEVVIVNKENVLMFGSFYRVQKCDSPCSFGVAFCTCRGASLWFTKRLKLTVEMLFV